MKTIFFFILSSMSLSYSHADAISDGHIAVQRWIEQNKLDQERVRRLQAEKEYKTNLTRLENQRRQSVSSKQNSSVPSKKQLNEIIDAINSDEMKDVQNYMNNLKPDRYQPEDIDPLNMEGFDTELKPQQPGKKYSFE